ncbi:MAG: anthranilate synthase component II, partial [Victivallales bacterium]
MILMIDNYDSFTYNLVQYISALGCEVVVKRNDELTVQEALDMKPDAIVISPGPGRPENAGISMELIKAAAGKIPLLGVCLGHQSIGQV